jgi:hypothetical protein
MDLSIRTLDGGMNIQKALNRSSGPEALLLMLASADRQMRILTPIVLPQALLMNRVQTKSLFRRTIRAEFVGHDRRRRKALPL